MAGAFEEIVEDLEQVENADKIYVDTYEYNDLVADSHANFPRINNGNPDEDMRIFGLEVVIVPFLEERVILDSSKFKKAKDFK